MSETCETCEVCGRPKHSNLMKYGSAAYKGACFAAWASVGSQAWGECKALGYEREKARAERAEAFKAFVHRRLDTAKVPTHPDGPHSKEGCRIGDRLDIVIAERDALRTKLAAAEAGAAALREAFATRPGSHCGACGGDGCSTCAMTGWSRALRAALQPNAEHPATRRAIELLAEDSAP